MNDSIWRMSRTRTVKLNRNLVLVSRNNHQIWIWFSRSGRFTFIVSCKNNIEWNIKNFLMTLWRFYPNFSSSTEPTWEIYINYKNSYHLIIKVLVCFSCYRNACHDSWTQLRLSPMFGCICPNNHMKRRCDRIFSMVNHNPCVGEYEIEPTAIAILTFPYIYIHIYIYIFIHISVYV